MKLNALGYWETTDATGHIHDRSLANALTQYLLDNGIKTVVDFGCGMGDYAKAFKAANLDVEAFDGRFQRPQLMLLAQQELETSLGAWRFDLMLQHPLVQDLPPGVVQTIADGAAQLAILVSCVGRKRVLGQRIEEEVESVREVLPDAVLAGFYAYGELCPHGAAATVGGGCELHNQTMTLTALFEA